jgi:hypothetical protein
MRRLINHLASYLLKTIRFNCAQNESMRVEGIKVENERSHRIQKWQLV